MKKVFLGGTVNGSNWRSLIIPHLDIDYFDPVVDDWDEKAYQKEEQEKSTSDYRLYVITPKMKGVYSIAEAVNDSHVVPEKTVFCYLKRDGKFDIFDEHQIKSLDKVGEMIQRNGGVWLKDLQEIIKYLNND